MSERFLEKELTKKADARILLVSRFTDEDGWQFVKPDEFLTFSVPQVPGDIEVATLDGTYGILGEGTEDPSIIYQEGTIGDLLIRNGKGEYVIFPKAKKNLL